MVICVNFISDRFETAVLSDDGNAVPFIKSHVAMTYIVSSHSLFLFTRAHM